MHYTYSEQRTQGKQHKIDAIALICICAIVFGALLGAFVAMT